MPSAIVIGAGVFGASVADRLARDGWEVTLVDRFEPGHPRSESGGETRLLRCSHGPDSFYTGSARRALGLWRELGHGVLVEPGVVWFARTENGWEAESERVLREAGIPVERVEPGAARSFFPSLAVDDLAFVLHEPEAGVLKASEAVRALVRRARDSGARVDLGAARPAGSAVEVAGRRLEADAVVWACGAWLAQLFPRLVTLRVTFQQLSLFEAPPEWHGPGWVDFDAATYGHALIEPFGFKAASDLGCVTIKGLVDNADAATAVQNAKVLAQQKVNGAILFNVIWGYARHEHRLLGMNDLLVPVRGRSRQGVVRHGSP